MGLQSHVLRGQVVAEMHLRPMPDIPVPCRILQTVRLVGESDRAAERAHLASFPGTAPPDAAARYAAGAHEGIQFAWERHSEGSTAMLVIPQGADDGRLRGWLEGFPGAVMRATRLEVVADEAAGKRLVEAGGMRASDVVSGCLGGARFWSDFRIHEEGFGLVVVAANASHRHDLARQVQQLQELGNYRNLALMGLALVRSESGELARIEAGLAEATSALSGGHDERALLAELVKLAAETAALRSASAFRLGATAAYGQIVSDRIKALDARPVEGLQSLQEFTDRRLLPALRTCEAFARRLETAATGIEQATAMLRTRVDLRLAEQNLVLLRSVQRNMVMQIRLQHLVEGFSIVALSYYAVSLLAKLLEGSEKFAALPWPPDMIAAAAVLPALVGFWLLLGWRKKRALSEPLEEGGPKA